jgi:hypothetical protein
MVTAVTDILGLDDLFAELVLGLGLAILVGNAFAYFKHRKGERPPGAEGEFRPGRVAFFLTVGVLITTWGVVSVFGR